MDGVSLQYQDSAFDVVSERASLHHIEDWRKALGEMVRVSRRYVLIEEPVSDPRSTGKRNGIQAQNLFFELQHEVSYPHFAHLPVMEIIGFLQSKGMAVHHQILPSEKEVPFNEFFEGYEKFVQKSRRPDYWCERLENFRKELGDQRIIENDTVFIEASKD